MQMSWIATGRKALWAVAVAAVAAHGARADVVVYSNDGPPGDAVTGSGDSSVAIGTSGWSYSNLRPGATIGISNSTAGFNVNYAPLGDGSVVFRSVDGTAKADINYDTDGTHLLSELTQLSYDWYRDSSSDNPGAQAPSLRLYVSDGVNQGYLVWEPTYNGMPGNVTTDAWVSSNAFAAGQDKFWATGSLPGAAPPEIGLKSIADWKSELGGYAVLAVNSGVGSGWNGTFLGAVDNIAYGFHNQTVTTNFEVVPEPSSIAMGLIAGGLGLAASIRRRRSR